MPSLRDSGKLVGRSASVKQVARQCNLSFPLSLRQFINTPGCPFSRCNRLHIKVLTAPTFPLTIEIMLNRMREVYSTAGIGVEVVSRENLTPAVLGNANFTTLNDLDVRACERGAPSNEQNQLFQNQNNVAADQRGNEIVVYFVRSVTATAGPNPGALNGCASHPNGQPGAAVDQMASQWTLAHEVGHVLGLNHIAGEHQGCPASMPQCCSTPDFTRLMTGCGTANIVSTPTIAQNEINTMTSSNLTRPC
jgi:Metallo-peptidase family M12B Reprolysin-like